MYFQIRRRPIVLCICAEEREKSALGKVRFVLVNDGRILLPFNLEEANLFLFPRSNITANLFGKEDICIHFSQAVCKKIKGEPILRNQEIKHLQSLGLGSEFSSHGVMDLCCTNGT